MSVRYPRRELTKQTHIHTLSWPQIRFLHVFSRRIRRIERCAWTCAVDGVKTSLTLMRPTTNCTKQYILYAHARHDDFLLNIQQQHACTICPHACKYATAFDGRRGRESIYAPHANTTQTPYADVRSQTSRSVFMLHFCIQYLCSVCVWACGIGFVWSQKRTECVSSSVSSMCRANPVCVSCRRRRRTAATTARRCCEYRPHTAPTVINYSRTLVRRVPADEPCPWYAFMCVCVCGERCASVCGRPASESRHPL